MCEISQEKNVFIIFFSITCKTMYSPQHKNLFKKYALPYVRGMSNYILADVYVSSALTGNIVDTDTV
jgi:hypothetical protein